MTTSAAINPAAPDLVLKHPVPTATKLSKRACLAISAKKKQDLQNAKIERERLRAEHKAKQKHVFKPIYVRRVNHKPTYCTVSNILLNKDELPGHNDSCPPTFKTKSNIQSAKSLCRLKNAVNWLLLFADKKTVKDRHDKTKPHSKENTYHWSFRLAFHTLTLSSDQIHSDDFIKEHMLQPYLYWLKRQWNCSYVWKAESQLNGNIHFHITVDQYVPKLKMIRKWNQILRVYDYLTAEESERTSGRATATTQVKAVLHESKCAKDIADYVAKKDKVPTVISKGFKSIWEGEVTCTKDIRAAFKYLRYGKTATEEKMLQVVQDAAHSSQLHCKFFSPLDPLRPRDWKNTGDIFKRVIDGRLWACSEELSKVDIFIEEGDQYLKGEDLLNYEERIFFRQNPYIYNLGKTLIRKHQQLASKQDAPTRVVLCNTDEDIERKFQIFENVWIHPHLSLMKKGSHLQKLIHEAKLLGKFSKQKYFTAN